MKSFARSLCILSLTAFFAACGGGGGGGDGTLPPRPPPPPPPPPTADYTALQLDPLPGHDRANANDINDNGQIVGWSGGQQQTAVLWTIDGAGVVTVQDLGMLPGGTFSIGQAINNNGQIVGFADGASGTRRPFIWTDNDGMSDLGLPVGLVRGQAHRINDNGQVVGAIFQTENSDLLTQGRFAVWTVDAAGAVTNIRDLGTLGGVAAAPFDNNVHGNVAGDIWFGSNQQTAFFWSEVDGVIEIDAREGLGINDNDEVVGWLPDTLQGFAWTASAGLTVIPNGVAMTINNSGQVAGRTDGGSVQQAYIWEGGEAKLLPMPENRDFSWGLSINETGWIVGWSTDVDGNEYANLWLPN